MNKLEKPFFTAEFQKVFIQQVLLSAFLLPFHEIFFLRASGAVPQTFGIIAGKHKLNGWKEELNKLLLLVYNTLPDAIAHGYGAAFQLQHSQGNTVYV